MSEWPHMWDGLRKMKLFVWIVYCLYLLKREENDIDIAYTGMKMHHNGQSYGLFTELLSAYINHVYVYLLKYLFIYL